jgi:hypothetical protein
MRCVNLQAAVEKIMRKQNPSATLSEQAEAALLALVNRRPPQVFHEQQLQVLFEPYWSHTTTTNALTVLREKIQTEVMSTPDGLAVRFYSSDSLSPEALNRLVRRRLKSIAWSSSGNVGRRIGAHAERLVLDAFERLDGEVLAVDTNVCEGRSCSGDRQLRLDAFVRILGESYGIEIKNMLDYPNALEMKLKRALANAVGTRPVLVTRDAPASWDAKYEALGGFVWRLGRQVFPPSRRRAARTLQRQTGLPIEACDALSDADCQTLMELIEQSALRPRAA